MKPLSNHNVPHAPIQAEKVSIFVEVPAAARAVSIMRIDEAHANPQKAWEEMGSPVYLRLEQIEELIRASELVEEPVDWRTDTGVIMIDLVIQLHSVVAILIKS